MITYDNLWKTLEAKGYKKYDLVYKFDISRGTMDNLVNNRIIKTSTIDTLCDILDCTPNDILTHTKNKK